MQQVLVGELIVPQDLYVEKEQMILPNIHVLKETIVLQLPQSRLNVPLEHIIRIQDLLVLELV